MGRDSWIGTVIWSKTRRATCGRRESDVRRDYGALSANIFRATVCEDNWKAVRQSAHDARSAYHDDAFRAPRGLEGAGAAIASNAAEPPWFYHSYFENLRVGTKSERCLQKTEHFYLFIHLLKHLAYIAGVRFLRNF